MGTVAITNLRWESAGSQKKAIATLTFSSSYATGGDTITPQMLGLGRISDIDIEDAVGYFFQFVNTDPLKTGLVKAYVSGSGTIANATITVSAGTIAHAVGFNAGGVLVADTAGGTITANNQAFTAGAATQVGGGVDLSTVSTTIEAYGA
jgi:hypothetical protein